MSTSGIPVTDEILGNLNIRDYSGVGTYGQLFVERGITLGPSGSISAPGVTSWLNVKAAPYNAKGDGVTDDTAAINAALNAVGSTGQPIYAPYGSYVHSSPLLYNGSKPLVLRGDGANATTFTPTNNSFDGIQVVNNHGAFLRDFSVSVRSAAGGSGGQTGSCGIRLSSVQDLLLKDVYLTNVYNGLRVTGGNVRTYGVIVSPADISDSGRFGFMCSGDAGNPNYTRLMDCSVSQIGQSNIRTVTGYLLANGYNSLTMNNCGSLSCGLGLWSTSNGGTAPNFLVTDQFTADHCGTGVTLDNGAYSEFSRMLITSSFNTQGGFNISSTYTGGPVQIHASNMVSTSGGIFIGGATDFIGTNLNLQGVTGTQCVNVTGAVNASITGLRASQSAGPSGVGTVNLDSGFTGSFEMTAFRLKNNSYGFAAQAGATGVYVVTCGHINVSALADSLRTGGAASSIYANVVEG